MHNFTIGVRGETEKGIEGRRIKGALIRKETRSFSEEIGKI